MSGRIHFSAFLLVSLVLASLASPVAVSADDPGSGVVPEYREGEVLVRLAPEADPDVLGPGWEHLFGRWYKVQTAPLERTTEAIHRLNDERYIEIAEPNRVIRIDPMPSEMVDLVQPASVTPNDPFYGLQWHLPAIEAPDAWETSSGSGVVVAIIDSGISLGGDDLDCRPLAGEYNAFTDSTAAGSATDDTSHGTHVAGTVGQCTNNGVGVAGVAGGSSLLAVKVLSADDGTTAELVKGIDWARAHGADVINMSLSTTCSPPPAAVFDAIDDAIAAGVVVVAAVGNDADEIDYTGGISAPACHPDVIAVGATDLQDKRSYYSNWGEGIDVVAPGGDVTADDNGDTYADGVLQETFDPEDPSFWTYFFLQGTSMAAPHVSGTAALMISANPAVTASQVKRALEVTAVDRGAAGWDMYYGYGQIDADRAIAAVLDTSAPTWSYGSSLSSVPGDTSANLSWTPAMDNIAVTDYVIWLDGSPVATTASNSYTLNGLAPATTYSVAVEAGDLMDNWSSGGPSTTFKTTGSADTQSPYWPAGADLDVVTGDDWVYLSWDAATDNVGVAGYRIRQDGVAVLTTNNTWADIEGLTEGTNYEFLIEAGDAAGNWSTTGLSIQLTTEDWSSPEWVSGGDLHVTDVFADRATFSWTPATDPSGIAHYDLYVDGRYHTTSATSLTVTGLYPAFEYMAWVEATDSSGNWSVGPELWFTTAIDFGDTTSSVFATDIEWLSGAGITKGCNPPLNTMYCPDSYVTRGQMAAFLVRAMGYTDAGSGDLFVDDDGSVFESDIDRLAVAGVTRGCNPPDNTMFCPNARVTRGQMAAFLHRALASQ